MIKSYFKIAWRNITKNRIYSAVNIIGLSAGIAFTLLIGAYAWSEWQVNSHLKNADRQYILQSKWKDPGQGIVLTTLGPLAKALWQTHPDLVANYYRWDGITSNVSKGDRSFREGLQVCDSTMLPMYGFSLLQGDPKTAFDGPFSLVITAEKALKYFGRTDVVGQTLTIENFSGAKHDFMITGILAPRPKNSVTQIDDNNDTQFYIPSGNIGFFNRNMEGWPNQNIVGYIELQKGVSPRDLEKPIQYLLRQNAPPAIAANLTPYLVPLKEYHLAANNGLVKKMIYSLSAIALFILLMAVINFVNISVSRSASRMKEIGIRKVLGGLKRQLIFQFLTESAILVSLSMVIAVAAYWLARPLFDGILGTTLPALGEFPLYFIAFPVVLIGFVGLVAGIYPAFVLSSLKSVDSLKGKLVSTRENVLLRKSLVAFQFGTASIVFIGAIIISEQVQYFFSKDLGYDRNYVVSAQVPRDWTQAGSNRMENLRNRFAAVPQVENTTLSYEVPNGNNSGSAPYYRPGSDSTRAIAAQELFADEYYSSTYTIRMVAGVFFNAPGAPTDSSKIVINETEARAFGWTNPQDAIGRQLMTTGAKTALTIAGVTKDFHFGSMQQAIQPTTFLQVGLVNRFRFLSFKLKPGNITRSIDALQKRWSVLLPGAPFEYKFMDDTLKGVYRSELQLQKAAYTATILSLIIVLLGVIGLVSLSIQKRTKEIGIRKLLGSSVKGIVALFMKEFLGVILVAGLIACPLAYILMHYWLTAYAYRIDISARPFVLAMGMLGLTTAVLIVVQTIKTAMANPVNSLHSE